MSQWEYQVNTRKKKTKTIHEKYSYWDALKRVFACCFGSFLACELLLNIPACESNYMSSWMDRDLKKMFY